MYANDTHTQPTQTTTLHLTHHTQHTHTYTHRSKNTNPAHPSSKYGIPFCVALRSAFGPLGARLPGLLSALLALPWCAWLLLLGGRALTAGIARVRFLYLPPPT